ncbi:MAG TPA: YncE family protein [bacterium]
MRPSFQLTALFLLGIAFSSTALADPSSFFRQEQDVPLTGGVSRFDYQIFDPETGFLYISHMGAGQIIIFNTKNGQIANSLSGFPGVTGLFLVPGTHQLYASVTQKHQVVVLNTENLKVVARIPAGHFPDGMAYLPDLHQLYVSDEMGGEVTVIDVLKNKRIVSIPMGGEVGNVRYDPKTRLVFVNVQTKNELVSINPQTQKIEKRYPLASGKRPHGLFIDPNSHLAFLGCQGNAKLVIMDLNNFEEIGVSDVGKDPDVLTFDPQLGYLYVASESGVASVFRVRKRKVEKIGDFAVGDNAHSVEVDPTTHFAYFPLRKINKIPVLRIMKPEY